MEFTLVMSTRMSHAAVRTNQKRHALARARATAAAAVAHRTAMDPTMATLSSTSSSPSSSRSKRSSPPPSLSSSSSSSFSSPEDLRRLLRRRQLYYYAYPSVVGPVGALSFIAFTWCLLIFIVVRYVHISSLVAAAYAFFVS